MRTTVLSLLLALLCFSCKEKVSYVLRVPVKTLSTVQMYDIERVQEVIFDGEEQNLDSIKRESRMVFLKGVDYLRNKKDASKAIKSFTSSILIFPDAKTYYELADALFSRGSSRDLDDAMKAYTIAEELGFQPAFMILFNKAKIQYTKSARTSNKDEKESLINAADRDLKNAFVNGFRDTALIVTNGYFGNQLDQAKYVLFKESFISSRSDNGMFGAFLSGFGPVQNDFVIEHDKPFYRGISIKSISYDFNAFIPEMENTKFSRDVSHEHFFVAKVAQTANYIALVYGAVSFWADPEPVNYTLAIFDLNGNRISSMPFACDCSLEKVKSGKISGDRITVEDFRREWQSPVTSVPVSENTVSGYSSIAKATYRIREDGRIEEESVPGNYEDKVKFANSESIKP